MANKLHIAAAVIAAVIAPVTAIWPVPQQLSTGSDVLFIDKSMKVTYNGDSVSWTSGKDKGKDRSPLQTRGANDEAQDRKSVV